MKFCASCGAQLDDDAKFCMACGAECADDFGVKPFKEPQVTSRATGASEIEKPDIWKQKESTQASPESKPVEPVFSTAAVNPTSVSSSKKPQEQSKGDESLLPEIKDQKSAKKNNPSVWKKLSQKGKIAIIGGLIVLLILGGIGITIHHELLIAKNEFNSAKKDLLNSRAQIPKKLSAAREYLSYIHPSDVLDVKTLSALTEVSDSTTLPAISIPKMASNVKAIKVQTADLKRQEKKLQTILNKLDHATTAVFDSVRALANKTAKEKKTKTDTDTPENQPGSDAVANVTGTYSVTFEDGQGNRQKATLRAGEWIRGSAKDTLQTAWENVGGVGNVPTLKEDYFNPSTAAYFVGTLSVQNMTPDYPASNFDNGNCTYFLNASEKPDEDIKTTMRTTFAVQYSDGLYTGGTFFARPDMKSNNWGPVPFIFGCDGVFIPNFPNGNPDINKLIFNFSSGEKLIDASGGTVGQGWSENSLLFDVKTSW